MNLLLDHVTIAAADLGVLQRAFAGAGLAAEYGGLHSNGVTHMALVGLDDGTYIELISTLHPGVTSPWWPRQIAADGGPCAWCARVEDLAAECTRLRALDVPVRGPLPYQRIRPDGTRIEWDLAFPGVDEPGAVLPFLIQDRTPREMRVRPSASVHDTDLVGVATVVIAVADLTWNTLLFERVYGWVRRETRPEPTLGAMVVSFKGAPVALASPLESGSWLGRRLAEFGDSPALLLLRSSDLAASERRFRSARRGSWMQRPALWLEPDDLRGTHIGVIE